MVVPSGRFVAPLVAFLLLIFAPGAPAESIVFRDVRLFDGEKTRGPTTVVVRDGVIQSTGQDAPLPARADVIDGTGSTLLPGLIDAHTHTFTTDMLRQALIFGVTTELDMFTAQEFATAMRAEQKAGEARDRADLLSAGTLVTAPGGHGTEYGLPIPTITSADEAQAFVDARIAEGSDYTKIVYDDGRAYGFSIPTISKDVLAAVIAAAHKRQKLAVVHIGDVEAAREAIAAGADGLVHVFCDQPIDDEFIKLLVEKKAFIIPTLSVIESVTGSVTGKSLVDDADLAPFIPPGEGRNLLSSFPKREAAKCNYAHAREAVRRLKAAGVPILAGTDAPNPGTAHGVSIHRELELLVDAGLSPVDALAAATSVPAAKFGLAERGRIAPKLPANLLLVKGDPTTDIKATRRIVGVWKHGHRMDRDAVRESVRTQKEQAASAKESPPPPGSEKGLVSDFEGKEPTAEFGAGWQTSTDMYVGGHSKAEFKLVGGGANASKGALLISGEIEDRPQPRWAGAIFYPGVAPMAPTNLSGKKAISFWTKGDGKTYSVMVFSQSRGYQPSMKVFVAGNEWKQYRFEISAFEGADGRDLMGLFFGGGNQVGKFELRIDDVRFEK